MILKITHDGNEIEAALPDGSTTEVINHTITTMSTLANVNSIVYTSLPVEQSPEDYEQQYERELAERQKNHLENISKITTPNYPKPNWRPCMHDQCTSCHGTGVTFTGNQCIHNLSCPCPKCTPTY